MSFHIPPNVGPHVDPSKIPPTAYTGCKNAIIEITIKKAIPPNVTNKCDDKSLQSYKFLNHISVIFQLLEFN